MPSIKAHRPPSISPISGRLARRSADPGPLFVYGTLLFPEVLQALLGRVPEAVPASIAGWRAAALSHVVYPVLVTSERGEVRGNLITDLTDGEWCVIDAFEDTIYELHPVHTVAAQQAWTYAGVNPLPVDGAWDAGAFEAEHLRSYVGRCARWAEHYHGNVEQNR